MLFRSSEVAGGAELDDALVQGLGKYIREGGTLGSVDLPETNIDLGIIEDVVKDVVRPIGAVATEVAKFVEKAVPEDVDKIEDALRAVGSKTEDVVRAAGSAADDAIIQPIREAGKVIDDEITQPIGDAFSALDTAVRQALPDVDLPSVDLNLGGLLTGAGAVAIPQLSATRTTDDLFKDELFKFQTEIGVDVEPLEYVDLNAPAENFFEDPILGRSYNF